MTERLVDVLDANGQVIHTYPITLGSSDGEASIASYEAKALQAAAHGQLVPDSELASLTACMHRSHGGPMQPYGDLVSSDSETRLALEQAVRERAYLLWEEEGRPDGLAEEYWRRALDQHLRERAYVLWRQEGSPEGGAEEYWRRLQDFQAQ
ncbi:MAG: DUF2934 domain-containing protein [Beijerinckiaceae bacterium]|nr:DUF2934 domain-containing protein [Beijerinckiaceae bacterium]